MPFTLGSLDPILDVLDEALKSPRGVAFLAEERIRLLAELSDPEEPISLDLDLSRAPPLPEPIRSARLFRLPAGVSGKRERHPNSHQRVLSLMGSGSIRVWDPQGASVLHRLAEPWGPGGPSAWSSVPPGLWHQPSAGEGPWIGLALHTAPVADLIDEYAERV